MLSIQRTIEQCITIYNVVLVHKQVLPAHQRWKLVIMYACLSWLSLRCWMWKHYATCIRTIITWLKCGLCKGGTVVTCVVVLTWVWNNKRKVAAERMKGIQLKWELCCTYGRAEINRLDLHYIFLGLALHVRIRSHQNDRRWSWTYQFPVWYWIALMCELHRKYSSVFICVASCTQYLGSFLT